ncbi:MAG TPA: GGDEF domain-containing protein [Acidimicrobiales bacterium]|nr:GGDEF domain-containing protein [Acidimicrobiales bacterium]
MNAPHETLQPGAGKLSRLAERAWAASSPEERASCFEEIEAALAEASAPGERAAVLMCRVRLRSNQWLSRHVMDDALEAMRLFEEAGQPERSLDAASLVAAHASRLGELSIAAELATKCIVAYQSIDDSILVDVANRLAIFCHSFLDYDGAVEQSTIALRAAERCGEERKVFRQLHNVASAALLAVRAERALGTGDGRYDHQGADRLEVAATALRRLEVEAPAEYKRQIGLQHLRATLLIELGQPDDALALLKGIEGGPEGIVWAAAEAAAAIAEARCLRALGRPSEAVAAAKRGIELAADSDDRLQQVLFLSELVAAEREAGEFEAAATDAAELNRRTWLIHSSQTSQLVQQVWARAALEQERRSWEAQTAAAVRSAEEDALTRIGNRRLLERALGELSERGTQIGLLMVDIDHFKIINDTFGHEVGDHVLRTVGELLAGEARVGQLVVRYGGEEFVFALQSVEVRAAGDFAERVRLKVSGYRWDELELRLQVSVSIGVATGPAASWRSVLRSADRAMYLAKQKGRNRVEVTRRGTRKTA